MSERQLSDFEILEKIKAGDRHMLLELYSRNRHLIRNLLHQNSGNDTDVDDILQEAVIAFWQQAQRKEFELTAKINTLIYAIARNHWLKELRRRKKLVNAPEPEDSKDEAVEADNVYEANVILTKYVKMLSDSCREILWLFYFDGLEMEEIASKLNFANADTVKAKKYQCKKKLEDLIKKDFRFEDLI